MYDLREAKLQDSVMSFKQSEDNRKKRQRILLERMKNYQANKWDSFNTDSLQDIVLRENDMTFRMGQ